MGALLRHHSRTSRDADGAFERELLKVHAQARDALELFELPCPNGRDLLTGSALLGNAFGCAVEMLTYTYFFRHSNPAF